MEFVEGGMSTSIEVATSDPERLELLALSGELSAALAENRYFQYEWVRSRPGARR